MVEVASSSELQQSPNADFVWPAFSQIAFRKLCEPIKCLLARRSERPPIDVPFDELDDDAQGAVAHYVYPLTLTLTFLCRERGWDVVFDPSNTVSIAAEYHRQCREWQEQYEKLEGDEQALWEHVVKEAVTLLKELHAQPQYNALKPSQTSRDEREVGSAISYALSRVGIYADGMGTIQSAESILQRGGAAKFRPEFRKNLKAVLLPLLQNVRFYPVGGEFNDGREETARRLAGILEQAL